MKAHKILAVGFDVTTETCHTLPEIEPLGMSSWEEATLSQVVYNVLVKNAVLKGKHGKKGKPLVNRATKFTKFRMT